ncbi:substrate-binding and VWA domain-containing protein [Streptomyces coryli]|nr:substrate-binding and VWA domain-containing protein [Streptomyces coryli]
MPDEFDEYGTGAVQRRGVGGRTIAISTALVLAVTAGTVVAARSGMLPFFGGNCDGDRLRLNVAASPDIAPVAKQTAERAREDKIKTAGKCLDIRVKSEASSDTADELSRGTTPDVQVWLPDSTLWVDTVAASPKGVQVDGVGQVASSPIALAAVPPAAKGMGFPKKTYSWKDLAKTAGGGKELRVGSADPARSATGLLALTYITKSTGGTKGGGTLASGTAKQLSQRIQPGDEEVLASLPHDSTAAELGNPKRNQALILSEQAAFSHNKKKGSAPGLDLFYPKDGTAALDYPYTIVDDEGQTTEQSRAANRFLTLMGDAQTREALHDHGFRTTDGADDVQVAKTAGGAEPQPITEDPAGPPPYRSVRQVLNMWTITVQSARFMTVVDVSGSMTAPVSGRPGQNRMDITKAALIQGLSQFTGEDEVGMWRFSTRLDGAKDYEEVAPPRRLADATSGGKTQRDRLTAAYGGLEPVPNGATGLHDTMLAAYKKAVEGYASGKFNAVVLLTDGANDDPGSISEADLKDELKKAVDPQRPVIPIVIAIGPEADGEACKRIARAAGGGSYQVNDPADINTVILKAVMDAGTKMKEEE